MPLDNRRPAPLTLRLDAGPAPWVVAGVAVAIVVAVAIALMGLAVTAFLAACLAAGFGLTWLVGLPLGVEERVAYGSVAGAMAASGLGFLVALVFGFGPGSVAAGALLAVAASAPGWVRARTRLRDELGEAAARWRKGAPWPLWLLLLIAWPFTFMVLSQAYVYSSSGLEVWGIGVYSDWAAHLTYTGSFAFGHNFPPQYPIDPGHRLGYPFMVDFFAASLVALGSSLTSSLVLSSGYLGLAFPAVMCLAGARLLGSLAAAATGVIVFALAGGLGFVGLVADIDRLGLRALVHLPRLYTQDAAQNLQLLNPVLAYLLPQRSVLFGLEVAFIVVALLWVARVEAAAWRTYAALGVLAGMAPAFHVHGYGTVIALPAFWALMDRRREYLAYFVPALALGLPQIAWLVQPGAAQVHLQAGWLAAADGHDDNWVWFWLYNTGLFIPLLLAAQLVRGILPPGIALYLAPMWLWFVVPNLFVFQPWDWDNTKFFVFWYAFGALPVGALLVRLARRSLEGGVLAAGLAVVLCLSGALDISRTFDPSQGRAEFTSAAGVRLAEWIRGNTPAQARFAVAADHNEPVPTLGGRAVLAGYPGWLWTYGLTDWTQRIDEEKRVLAGADDAADLVGRYDVTYVVIGPQERADGANGSYWDAHGTLVYQGGGYSVYRVR